MFDNSSQIMQIIESTIYVGWYMCDMCTIYVWVCVIYVCDICAGMCDLCVRYVCAICAPDHAILESMQV
jgi:hypothetical protein